MRLDVLNKITSYEVPTWFCEQENITGHECEQVGESGKMAKVGRECMTSTPCPRLSQCSYRDKTEACLHNRGGYCYRWFLTASRYVDEE